MTGPYSTHQMDDFYAALGAGEVKPSGVMNLAQHLYVAQRCAPGSRVVDVCCGRGLSLPLLFRYAPQAAGYIGLDISAGNLAEARRRLEDLQTVHGRPFPVTLTECDVSEPWPCELHNTEVVVYTAALEHLPRDAGAASLIHAARALAVDGRLYLSTPNTKADDAHPEEPKLLQYGVHVYEWSLDELLPALDDAGLEVVDSFGLLPPPSHLVGDALAQRFGPGATEWYRRLVQTLPPQLLAPVVAAAFPDLSAEVMLVCRRRP